MVLGPVSFGILIRKIIPGLPDWWDRLATVLASLSIVMIIMVVVATNQEQLAGVGFRIVTGLVGLNLSAYVLAFGLAKVLGWPPRQRRTLLIEVGMQNAGLGSILAMTHLGDTAAIPSAFYTVLCVTTVAIGLSFHRRFNAGHLA